MLHRFEIALADVDRGVYESLDLRVARHPSEDVPYLLTRVLAFALEFKPGLAFSKGLSEGDEPALWLRDDQERVLEWIEVGQPAPDRLHRASKLAGRVVVYAHRRVDLLLQRCAKERIHRAHEIEIVRVPADLLARMEPTLDRNNRWDLSVHEGLTTLVVGSLAIESTFLKEPLAAAS
jgi:uncharacterized protein YaeQ